MTTREDIAIKPYAESLGFTADPGKHGFWKPEIPNDPYSFIKGNKHVWRIRDGWRVAKIVNGMFTSHVTVETAKQGIDLAEEWIAAT